MPITDSKNSAEKELNPVPQDIQYGVPYSQQIEDDTIDLYELWITLWNKKWLVIKVTVIAALGSVAYALRQPSIYKAEALVLSPSSKNVQALNRKQNLREPRQVGVTFTPLPIRLEVFTTFKNNLNSRILQKKFIEEHGLLDILAPDRTTETRDIEIIQSFSNMILIEKKGDVPFAEGFSITMESDDPEFAAKIINDYIRFFDLETTRNLVDAIQDTIQSQISEIEYTINSKRKIALIRRQDKIKRYEAAAIIASKLEAMDSIETTNVVQNNQQENSMVMSGSTTPLYHLGLKAVEAEILTLKNRKSDDPFIIGLRDLEEDLSLLRSIKIEEEGLHAVSIYQAAYPPKNPIKPNRRLIASLGTVTGLILGIFIVFFVSFVQKQKEIHYE